MTKWTCSKCIFGHNSEVVMIHHQIVKHRATYSHDKLKSIGYFKYIKRIKSRVQLKHKMKRMPDGELKMVICKK